MRTQAPFSRLSVQHSDPAMEPRQPAILVPGVGPSRFSNLTLGIIIQTGSFVTPIPSDKCNHSNSHDRNIMRIQPPLQKASLKRKGLL